MITLNHVTAIVPPPRSHFSFQNDYISFASFSFSHHKYPNCSKWPWTHEQNIAGPTPDRLSRFIVILLPLQQALHRSSTKININLSSREWACLCVAATSWVGCQFRPNSSDSSVSAVLIQSHSRFDFNSTTWFKPLELFTHLIFLFASHIARIYLFTLAMPCFDSSSLCLPVSFILLHAISIS